MVIECVKEQQMSPHNGTRRKITLCLVLCLLVTSIFIIAFHHHEDDGDHDDCPICIAAHQLSSVIYTFFLFAVLYAFIASVVPENALLFSSTPQSLLNSRSPPA